MPGAENRDARSPEAGGDTGGHQGARGVQGLIGAQRGGPGLRECGVTKLPLFLCLWTSKAELTPLQQERWRKFLRRVDPCCLLDECLIGAGAPEELSQASRGDAPVSGTPQDRSAVQTSSVPLSWTQAGIAGHDSRSCCRGMMQLSFSAHKGPSRLEARAAFAGSWRSAVQPGGRRR